MKHIKKTICTALILVISLCAVPYQSASAASVAELQAKRKTLAASTENARKEIEGLKNKQLSAEEEMEAMDKVLNSIQAEMEAAEADLNFLTEKLTAAEAELAAATEKRDAQFVLLGDRMKFLQQKGSAGYLEILLDSENFSDLIMRMQYVNDIMGYDKAILDELQAAQNTIQAKTDEIAESHAEQETVVAIQQEKVNEMEEIVQEKQALIDSYKSDMKKYEQMIAANQKADEAVLAEIARQSGTSTVYYSGSGSFGWPVPAKAASSSSLSSGYVNRISPISGKAESHSGYDIPAPYGSAIVAAEAGKVTYSGWMNGYGYTIMIDHGNGLSTLYGHNSSLVAKKGQVVSRGQTVAKCGSTGWSTGNHCHFSVLKNGAYVNPEPYLGVKNVSY
ncbi:murein hydrolase activator EnvC family protein [Anaerotignum sp.]